MACGLQFVVIGSGITIMVLLCFVKNWIHNIDLEGSSKHVEDWKRMQLKLEDVIGMING